MKPRIEKRENKKKLLAIRRYELVKILWLSWVFAHKWPLYQALASGKPEWME